MRSLSIDILKIILAAFVVCLHIHIFRDSFPSVSYVLVNGFFRIGVPVFLIISGYFFFFIDDISRLKKWSVRILLLYIIWSAVYFPFWKEDDNYILNILFGYHHLWYLIGTFFAGLLLFTVRKIPVKMLAGLIWFFSALDMPFSIWQTRIISVMNLIFYSIYFQHTETFYLYVFRS
jgi:hypothetical protein